MLEKLQIKPGERIALISENCPEFARAIIEIWESNAVAIPVNPSYPHLKLTDAIKKVSCAKAIYGFNKNGSSISPSIRSDFEGKIYSFEEFKKSNIAIAGDCLRQKKDPFSLLYADTAALQPLRALNDPASIIFTSGTTDKPRAVMHTAGNHYYSALGSNENIILSPQDIWLLCLPLYHISGLSLIMKSYLSGAAIAVANPQDIRMPLSEMIGRSHATHISLVPVQLHRLMQENSAVKLLRKLKAILIGGGTAADGLIKECLQNKLKIFKSYGSSEMASQVTTTLPADTGSHLLSSGKLLKYRELSIASDTEILVKGKTLFSGYVRAGKEETADRVTGDANIFLPLDNEGWFHTGDTGYIDSEGYLHVLGRKDTMFVSKGENIYPEEIESAVLDYPGIENAIAVPVNCPKSENVPAVFIKTAEKSSRGFHDIAGLKKFLEKKLEKVKIPEFYFELPKQKAGQLKPDREKLRITASKLIRSKVFQE